MPTQVTIPQELTPSKNELNHPPSDYSYTLWESEIREHGLKEAVYLAILRTLSKKEACSWISNENLAQKTGDSEATVYRVLNSLEEKKLLFRNTYPRSYGKGKQRYMVIHDYATLYWNKHLKENNKIPDSVKEAFLNFFFEGSEKISTQLSSHQLSENNTSQNDRYIGTRKMIGELSKDNLVINKGSSKGESGPMKAPNQEYALHQSRPPDPGSKPPAPTHEARDQLLSLPRAKEEGKGIREQLREAGIGGEQLELGIEYYAVMKKSLETKRSPVGAVVHALKKGYAADKLQQCKASRESKIVPLKGHADIEAHKAIAKEFQDWMEENPSDYRMMRGENCIYMSKGPKTIPLGFAAENFVTSLNSLKEKILGSIVHSH